MSDKLSDDRSDTLSRGRAHAGFRVGAFPPELPLDAVPSGTKGRILESALVAFAERGFHGTSIRTIADGVGINSATLYSHFASKEQILAALVTIGSQALLTRLEAELELESTSASTSTSVDRLDAIVKATVVAHATYPLLAIVTNSEFYALSEDLAAPALELRASAASLLREILTVGASDGSFTVDLSTTAHVLEGMAQQIPLWMDPSKDRPDELARAYVAIARRIVGAV